MEERPYVRGNCSNLPELMFVLFFFGMIVYWIVNAFIGNDPNKRPASYDVNPQIASAIHKVGGHLDWSNGYVYEFTYMGKKWKVLDQSDRIIVYEEDSYATGNPYSVSGEALVAIKLALKTYKEEQEEL